MKKISILLATVILSVAQVSGQRIFSNVAIVSTHWHNTIQFTLPSEANVMHYRIEASNNGQDFDIIGMLKASGNSVLSKTYTYELAGKEYKYYRIGKVGMNGSLQYSEVLPVVKSPAAEKNPFNMADPSASEAVTNIY